MKIRYHELVMDETRIQSFKMIPTKFENELAISKLGNWVRCIWFL